MTEAEKKKDLLKNNFKNSSKTVKQIKRDPPRGVGGGCAWIGREGEGPVVFQMYSFGSSSRPRFIFQPVALLVTLWGMTSGHTIDVMKSRGQQRDVV